MTMRRFVRVPGSWAPNAARRRKAGIAAVPTTVSALLRRKMRRVFMEHLCSWLLALGSWLLALGSWLLAVGSWLSRRPRAVSSEHRATPAAPAHCSPLIAHCYLF